MEHAPPNELEDYRNLGHAVIDQAEKKVGPDWVDWFIERRDKFIATLDAAGFKDAKLDYVGYHILIGSTPPADIAKVDFPPGLSVKEFYAELLAELENM